MRLALVTDAWEPQVNGVVSTLRQTLVTLDSLGVECLRVSPEGFRSVPCPTYPEIRLAWAAGPTVAARLDRFDPDAIHIATEGPLGLAARAWCLLRKRSFTTSYHTQFPEYVRARFPIPLTVSYAYLRWFHEPAARTLVSTPTMREQLARRGFRRLATWGRGVDTELFQPRGRATSSGLPRFVYLGRVAVEKNIEAFLKLDLPGDKWVIGDGPERVSLAERYPAVKFFGMLRGERLAQTLALGDVLVFPSRTDTFGLVMLEAMACGLPIAAYPVTGPIDVVDVGVTGILDLDLRRAALAALTLDRTACRRQAEARSWLNATRQFLNALEIRGVAKRNVLLNEIFQRPNLSTPRVR
ncbi:MAG: glycosyltransferase family 1 protein [Gammaproteobacteria bacterium]|nr:glycosyltransferase family 1 protein [Gammaproteobacteria bacterium]